MSFTDVETSNPDLLPIQWTREVIQEMAHTSAALGLSRRRTMSVRQTRMPATAALAGAYWVGSSSNDFTDLKQSTKAEWAGVNLIVEELAALVAVPHAHEQDNAFPVWGETRPQIVEAMAKKLDQAVFFGIDKPPTWPDALVPSIEAAGQTVAEGTTDDIASDVALAAQQLKRRGHRTTGFAAEPGFQWGLVGMRSADGVPIYQENLAGPIKTGLYGFPMVEVMTGGWDDDLAALVLGDWGKSIVGIRQDITFTKHDSGVISDEYGAVVHNAMQQDSTVWRAVMRIAWARANTATRQRPNPDQATGKFPFAAITPGS